MSSPAQRFGQAVALDGIVAEALERARQGGELIVATGVDADIALTGRQRQSGAFQRQQAAESVAAQDLDADQRGDDQQCRADDAKGNHAGGGAALGLEAGCGKNATTTVDEFAGQCIELGGQRAHLDLQGVAAHAQFELGAAQGKGTRGRQGCRQRLMQRAALQASAGGGNVADTAREQG